MRMIVVAILGSLCVVLLSACGERAQGDVSPRDLSASVRQGGTLGDEADYIFDPSIIRTYKVVVADDDWSWLNENELLEEYVPATLLFEGEEYSQVAVRYKGFFGALRLCFDPQGNRTCDKLSLKLKFSEYDDGLRFYGLKRLNFHSMQGDPTKMHDMLGYGLFREAGVFAPRTTYAKLIVNGELLGLFAVVEQIDGSFTRSRFADGGRGNVYKEVWPVETSAQRYIDALRTNREEEPSPEKMVRFAAALAAATDETFVPVLEEWTDFDALMNYLAVDRLIDNWDGIVAWYCIPEAFAEVMGQSGCFNHNYYWYEETERDRVWLIPWDLDHTFEVPSPIKTAFGLPDWTDEPGDCAEVPVFLGIGGLPPSCDPLIGRLATLTWEPYVEATQALLDGPFQIDILHERIDAIAVHIAPAVAGDPNGPSVEAWQTAVDKLKTDVVLMREYIEEQISQ